MSRNYSPKGLSTAATEENDFDPSRINVFLDIAEYDIIPKLTKYITLNGGKSSPFLDISVTHVVTDKAKTMTEIYHMTQKWNLKVWTVEEFASHLLSYMYSKGTRVNSPTLVKLTTIKRDLSQCLQEEKRQSTKATKPSATNQFASSRNNNETNNSISFVPFEAFYVIIEDSEGLHCPIFKEYPIQFSKDESAAHFKVPRLPYPIFYWESPDGQCPFIPPPAHEPPHQPTKKSSQLNAVEKTASAANLSVSVLHEKPQDLRARALKNSTSSKQAPVTIDAPKFVFEPAMTDTSILTAKTNMTRNQRHAMTQCQAQLPANPILKITPNFSLNVNRAVVSATTPKHLNSGNFKKMKHDNLLRNNQPTQQQQQQQQQQQSLQQSRKKEKNSGAAAVQRARPGFCECCCEKYSELEKHVKEPMHRQFALQSDNYEGIDNFLGGLKRQFKADYLYKQQSGNNNTSTNTSHVNNSIVNENSLLMESSLVIQNSPLSPTTTNSNTIIATARNYTGTKRMKQVIASKRVKMIANTTTSSILDEEDAEASGVVAVLSTATATNEAVSNAIAGANYISSPSCKRRKSFKLVQ